ncbi:hypothetical protein C8Q76DRAFT_802322 [Earliella scabrosa]|nr:hypothetical protein C8Q76DRAFT_802322 [Earliella scabrosa]
MTATGTSKCKRLLYLHLMYPESSLIPRPGLPFGSSITRLKINIKEGVSDGTLRCIRGFDRLKELIMVCTVDEPLVPGRYTLYTLRHLRSILSSVRSGSALQVIGIELQYRYMYNGVGMEPSYMLHRQYLIDDLLGNETVAILSGFPSLRLLYIDLFDYEHEEFDSQWWTAEMGRRLPLNLRAAVSNIGEIFCGVPRRI